MVIEVCNPLATRVGETEILFPLCDTRRNVAPVELWILLDEVNGTGVAEWAAFTGFLKSSVQRIGLVWIKGVAELSDEIGCLDKLGFENRRVSGLGRRRVARQFNRLRNPRGVENRRVSKPLKSKHLGAVDVIRGKGRVGRAPRKRHSLPAGVHDE